MEGFPVNQPVPESSGLTDREKVVQALQNTLGDDALALYTALVSPMPYPQESFYAWVRDFNALPPEERGAGQYDQSRPLTDNVDVTETLSTPQGYPLSVTLHKNGEVTLSTSLDS